MQTLHLEAFKAIEIDNTNFPENSRRGLRLPAADVDP